MLKSVRLHLLSFTLAAIMLASLACSGSPAKQLADAAKQPATAEPVPAPEDTKEPTKELKPTAESAEALPAATPEPTEVPPTREPTEPPATPTRPPQAVKVTAQGFGQDDRTVGFAFIVENPNTGSAMENSQYQVAAYDESGAVIETDSGYIELLWPNQRLGVGGTLFLDEGVIASKVEVQLREGTATAVDETPTFQVDAVALTVTEYSSRATAVLTNPYKRNVTNLRVSAVAFDSAGEIVGGGFTFLDFVLANGTTGVEVPFTSLKTAASVELYPVISGLSFLTPEEELPSGAVGLVLSKHGFGQDERELGYGFLVENANQGFAVEGTQYHLTAYDANGAVIEVEEGYVTALMPGQKLGVAGTMYLDRDTEVARVDVQILAGDYEKTEAVPLFTAENVTYQHGDYASEVTGRIISPYAKDITNLRVSALAYNEASDIIGGGFTFLDFVPANGKAAVEVPIVSAGKPASVELYASVSGLSDFE